MNKKIAIFLTLLFFFFRFFFLNQQSVFFDSPEYLTRLSDPSYLNALSSGHLPLHSGYILIFWPIFQIGKFLNINPAGFTIVCQILLSFLTVYYFYRLVKIISKNNLVALISCLIISLLPLYWIANVTVMMETTYLAFFVFSLYFLAKYLTQSSSRFINLFLSSLFFGLAFLTHTIVLLWLPLIFLMFSLRPTRSGIIYFGVSLITFSLINTFFISVAFKTDLLNSLVLLYSGKLAERSAFNFPIEGILVYLRNFMIPILRNNTSLIVLLSLLGLIKAYFKDRRMFVLFLLWIGPAVITNQWWDSLFFGRHALIASFGLAFLAAYILANKKAVFALVIIYLLISVLPAMGFLKKEIPYLQQAKAVKDLPENSLIFESHFARPQITDYGSKIIFVDEVLRDKEEMVKLIQDSLKTGNQVFVSSQALSEPYGLYSGPYVHSLTLSYKKDFILKTIMENFTLEKYKEVSKENNLVIYKIVSDKPSAYPKVQSLIFSNRRIDYFDPISQIWFFIRSKIN